MTEVLYGLAGAQRERVAALREQGRFFWLDASLSETGRDELTEALGIRDGVLPARRPSRAFHADADSIVFSFRCYLEWEPPADESGYRLRPIEVQVLVTGEYLLTVHEEPVSLPDLLAPDLPEGRSKRYVVYAVLDAMLGTTFGALEEVELRLEAFAATWTDSSAERVPRGTLQHAGARLATMRRWTRAEQGITQRIGLEISALPGFDTDDEPYFDRLDEEVNRLLGAIDAAANGLGMLLDLQLNERAYVVSVVATIFVPLTFVTGFFGMNFGWLVDHIKTPLAFLLLAICIPIVAGALSWRLLVRRFVVGDRA
jgi:magnesium transporter